MQQVAPGQDPLRAVPHLAWLRPGPRWRSRQPPPLVGSCAQRLAGLRLSKPPVGRREQAYALQQAAAGQPELAAQLHRGIPSVTPPGTVLAAAIQL